MIQLIIVVPSLLADCSPLSRTPQAMRLEPKFESVLQLPYVAQLTGAWTTHDPQVLPVLDDFHVWTEQVGGKRGGRERSGVVAL